MKDRFDLALPELYEPVWDLKRKREWADRVESNLHRVTPCVPHLLAQCEAEFGYGSVQECAMRASARFLIPMTEIFIAQLRMPTLSGCSWTDIAPEACGRLLKEHDDLLVSHEFSGLEKASPLYGQIFSLLPKWTQLRDRREGEKLTDRSVAMAAHLSRDNLPVLLISQGEAYTKHVDPDLRLIFPTMGHEFRIVERGLQEHVWQLAGRKKGFVYQPAIVGDLRFAAGSQWASLTVGEQLRRAAMLCPNVYKSMPIIREITLASGLPFDEAFVRDCLTQLYSSHEFAHKVFKDGPDLQLELRADMPSVACTFALWEKQLDDKRLKQAIVATHAEYLKSLRDGLYGEAQWDAYYYSATSYFEDVFDSGLATVASRGFVVHPECLPRAIEFFSRRVKKPMLTMNVSNQLSPMLG